MDSIPNPKIALLLPVFNGEQYLHQCISSILSQSMTEFEVIIGNDCSTDKTHEIIQQFSDQRIRYIANIKNQGLFPNLNIIAKLAKAPLLRCICQDDTLTSDCLENEIAFFDNHPDIGMTFCKSKVIDQQGIIINQGVLGDLPEVIKAALSLQLLLYYGCIPGNLSTVCVRRECFENFGFFNESFQVSGDYEMWVRICQQKALGVIHKHLVNIRSHEKQLSRASESGVRCIIEDREIRSKILPLLPEAIRPWAKFYCQIRQNVWALHHSIHCLISGKYRKFIRIFRLMGLREYLITLLFWLVTFNNKLYRPKPRFLL